MKKYLLPLLWTFLLALILFTVFVLFDFFPYKYSMVEKGENQLVLETGMFEKQLITITPTPTPDKNFELTSVMINYSVQRLDYLLTIISLELAPLILAVIGSFQKNGEKSTHIISTVILLPLIIAFLFLYYHEVTMLQNLIDTYVS